MANVRPINRIISAQDYGGSATAYIRKWQRGKLLEGISVFLRDLEKRPATGVPFVAVIWQGQWIIRTECCNSASFVDPNDPIAYCFSCANRSNDNRPRPVIFPPEAERQEIERLLLERPVEDVAGLTDMERAGLARPVVFVERDEPETGMPESAEEMLHLLAQGKSAVPVKMIKRVYPLVRSWEGESVAQLRAEQQEPIRKFHEKLKEKGGGPHGI